MIGVLAAFAAVSVIVRLAVFAYGIALARRADRAARAERNRRIGEAREYQDRWTGLGGEL